MNLYMKQADSQTKQTSGYQTGKGGMCMHRHVQSYLTLCDSIDCGLPGSSVHGVFQAKILV